MRSKLVILMLGACLAVPAATAAAPAKARSTCKRVNHDDQVTVTCKDKGVVGFSFRAVSTRPGMHVSYAYTCEAPSVVSGVNIGGPAAATGTPIGVKGTMYSKRFNLLGPEPSQQRCRISVTANASPNPIRPDLTVRIHTVNGWYNA